MGAIGSTNSGNIHGFHSYFPYYGEAHLIVNLFHYIRDGLDQNEIICTCIKPESYNRLIDLLHKHGIDSKMVIHFSLDKKISFYKRTGKEALEQKIKVLNKYVTLAQGYSGLRSIVDLSYIIKKTSKSDFLQYETIRSDVIAGKKISILCLCDYDDYLGNQRYIDSQVMEMLEEHHSHRLFQFGLEPIKSGFSKYTVNMPDIEIEMIKALR